MPLDAQSECGSVSNAYRFDRAVLGHTLHDNAIARVEDGLTMQRVHADGQATEESGEYAVGDKPYLMAIGEHDRRIAMKTSVFCARRTVVHAARKVSHLGVERPAESDIHLLKSAADTEQGHASVDARPYKGQSYRIAITVVGLVPGIRVYAETGRMHVEVKTRLQVRLDQAQDEIRAMDLNAQRHTGRSRAMRRPEGWLRRRALPMIRPERQSQVEVRIGNCLYLLEDEENIYHAAVTVRPTD